MFVSVEGVGTGRGKDFGAWYIAINQQTQLCSFTWISVTGIISCIQLRWPPEQSPSTRTEVFTLDRTSDIIPTHNMTFNCSSEISFGAFWDSAFSASAQYLQQSVYQTVNEALHQILLNSFFQYWRFS